MDMERFRVKVARKKWTDNGPDLLRTDKNAEATMRGILIGAEALFVRKKGETTTEWAGPMTRADVMDMFRFYLASGKRDEFQVGEKRSGKVVQVAQARREFVPRLALAHCTVETEELHSLIHYQFPGVIHSGGFLYRQVEGSSAWSDHAWGTAVDESQNLNKGVRNDEVFDWQARMAQSGNIDPDYIIGSKAGDVVQCAAPDYEVEPSSSSESHLWHVHTSQVDHDGRKPPRNPMVS